MHGAARAPPRRPSSASLWSPTTSALLPTPLRKRIADAETESTDWALVVTGGSELTGLVQDVVARLASMVAADRRKLTEDNIELLVRSMLRHASRSRVDARLEFDNARLRGTYLQEVPRDPHPRSALHRA